MLPASQGCTLGDLRLAGGQSVNEGRVEICINGVWGTVCGDRYWSSDDVRFVCRLMGFYSYGGTQLLVCTKFGY